MSLIINNNYIMTHYVILHKAHKIPTNTVKHLHTNHGICHDAIMRFKETVLCAEHTTTSDAPMSPWAEKCLVSRS